MDSSDQKTRVKSNSLRTDPHQPVQVSCGGPETLKGAMLIVLNCAPGKSYGPKKITADMTIPGITSVIGARASWSQIS